MYDCEIEFYHKNYCDCGIQYYWINKSWILTIFDKGTSFSHAPLIIVFEKIKLILMN